MEDLLQGSQVPGPRRLPHLMERQSAHRAWAQPASASAPSALEIQAQRGLTRAYSGRARPPHAPLTAVD